MRAKKNLCLTFGLCLALLAGTVVNAATADFNGGAPSKSDILWRNTSTGENAIWLMDGSTLTGGAYIPSVPTSAPGWYIAGVGDFNGDGKADILWRNTTTGDNAIWLMNGLTMTSSALIPGVSGAPSAWVVAGVGDFNGDGKADILWRNTTTGDNALWLMNGLTLSSSALIPGVPAAMPGWTIAGVGDFNGDGKADILWRNTTTGDNAIWLMNGLTISSSALIPGVATTPSGWIIAGVGDFNGDGKADILWRNTATGSNATWLMNGFTITSSALIPGVPAALPGWIIAGVGDFSGDGKADIMWRNTSTGDNAIWLMNGFTLTSSAMIMALPANWSGSLGVPTANVALAWDPVTAPNLNGYRLYYGTTPGTYLQPAGQGVNVGNVTTYTVPGLTRGKRYYFAAKSVDTSGNESAFSNEAFKDIP